MPELSKANYNINSLKDFHGYLQTYLFSLDKHLSLEQADSHLQFFLDFACLYIDAPSDSSSNSFSIILSGNAEQILFETAQILTSSVLFENSTMKMFLISKLLSILDLNFASENINLRIFLGFVFISLFLSKNKNYVRTVDSDTDDHSKFDVADIEMDEDSNGNYITNLDKSVLDIFRISSSFKIFYKILYFNVYEQFHEVVSKSKSDIAKSAEFEYNLPYEAVEHKKFIDYYSLDYVQRKFPNDPDLAGTADNINFIEGIEEELHEAQEYYNSNFLEKERSILYPDTTQDLNKALEKVDADDIMKPSSSDKIVQSIINNDSEFASIVYSYKKIILSKIYMKLLSNFLKLSSLTFEEITFIDKSLVLHYLLKNLSIFEDDEDEEDDDNDVGLGRKASVNKRGSVRLDNGVVFNDTLSKDLVQFAKYKKYLKKINKNESKTINVLKFFLLLIFNEQFIMASHNQSSLQSKYDRRILAKLLYYKNLKLIQIKTEFAKVVERKLEINESLENAYQVQYAAELQELERLQTESLQTYGGAGIEYSIDAVDLYSRVSLQFAEEFEKLDQSENRLQYLKDVFEQNLMFGVDDMAQVESNFNEFVLILKKDHPSVDPPTIGSLQQYLKLNETEILQIVRPKIKNVVFNCLIGTYHFQKHKLNSNAVEWKETVNGYVNFIAFLIYSFNRQVNNCNKILILKMLYLIFKEIRNNNEILEQKRAEKQKNLRKKRDSIFNADNRSIAKTNGSEDSSTSPKSETHGYEFYFNDLKVLVDIFIRELYNLSPDTQITVINNYLRVFFLLLDVSPLNYLKFNSKFQKMDISDEEFNYDRSEAYKRRDILDLLLYLGGFNINELAKKCHDDNGQPPDILSDAYEKSPNGGEAANEDLKSTRKLARKCLSIGWLGIKSYIVEKAFQLYGLQSPNEPQFFPNPLSRTSTMSSSSSSTNIPASNSSTERLTLSKKLSNLRLTNNSTGGSFKINSSDKNPIISPQITSPLKSFSQNNIDMTANSSNIYGGHHYQRPRGSFSGINYDSDHNKSNGRPKLYHSEGSFNTYSSNTTPKLQPPPPPAAAPSSGTSIVPNSPALTTSTSLKIRKKPPPPPAPSPRSSRATTPNLDRKLPPPPPPPSRKAKASPQIKSPVLYN